MSSSHKPVSAPFSPSSLLERSHRDFAEQFAALADALATAFLPWLQGLLHGVFCAVDHFSHQSLTHDSATCPLLRMEILMNAMASAGLFVDRASREVHASAAQYASESGETQPFTSEPASSHSEPLLDAHPSNEHIAEALDITVSAFAGDRSTLERREQVDSSSTQQ